MPCLTALPAALQPCPRPACLPACPAGCLTALCFACLPGPLQVDVQGEVSILQALVGCRHACQLYDFGVDPAADAMFLVLKDYRCSLRCGPAGRLPPAPVGSHCSSVAVSHTARVLLGVGRFAGCGAGPCLASHAADRAHSVQPDRRPRRQWRARQPASPAGQLRLYYAIFAEVVAAVGALLERGVVHFDLKCDNCLLEPLPGEGPGPGRGAVGAKPLLAGRQAPPFSTCRAHSGRPWPRMGCCSPGSCDGVLSELTRPVESLSLHCSPVIHTTP